MKKKNFRLKEILIIRKFRRITNKLKQNSYRKKRTKVVLTCNLMRVKYKKTKPTQHPFRHQESIHLIPIIERWRKVDLVRSCAVVAQRVIWRNHRLNSCNTLIISSRKTILHLTIIANLRRQIIQIKAKKIC